GVGDLDGHRRAQGAPVADAPEDRDLVLLEPHARAPPEPQPPPRQLTLQLLDGDGQPRREALDDHDEGPAMGFTGGEEAQHRLKATGGSYASLGVCDLADEGDVDVVAGHAAGAGDVKGLEVEGELA